MKRVDKYDAIYFGVIGILLLASAAIGLPIPSAVFIGLAAAVSYFCGTMSAQARGFDDCQRRVEQNNEFWVSEMHNELRKERDYWAKAVAEIGQGLGKE